MKTQAHRRSSCHFVASVGAAIFTLFLGGHAQATNGSWNQTGATANWDVNGNWTGNVFPNAVSDTATFNTALTANEGVTLGQNITVGSLTLGSTTGFSYNIEGANTLTLSNGGAGATILENSTVSGNDDTVTSPIVIADTGGLAVTNTSASGLTIAGGITSTGTTPNLLIQANSTGTINFSGTINNAGTITNSGSGAGNVTLNLIGANVTGVTQNSATSVLVLTGNNPTFTGPVVVQNGTLALTNQSSPAGTGTITLGNSSTLSTGASVLIGQDNTTETIMLGTGATANGGTLTIGNYLNNTPGVSDAVILNGNNLTIASGGTGSFGLGGGITGTGNVTLTVGLNASTVTISTNPINNVGTVTANGTGSHSTTISGGVGSNVTALSENSATSVFNISGALSVNSGGTTLTDASGAKALTVSDGVSGTGNLILDNNSATNGNLTLTTVAVNNTGTVTNSGTGAGSTTITAGIGSNVTGITESSTTSAFAVSGAVTVNGVGGTTITAASADTQIVTLSGGVTGTGNLILDNNSATANAITFNTTAINNAGTITNSGTGTGGVTVGALGTSVTGIIQNSATSPLTFTTSNSGTSTLLVQSGTAIFNVNGTPSGTGNITLGNSSTPSTGATILIGQVNDTDTITLGTNGTANGGTLEIGDFNNSTPGTSNAIILNGNNLTIASLGTGALNLEGGITGTGNVTLLESSTANATTLSTVAVNNSGTITNIGTSTGTGIISGGVGSNVTGITENSTSSPLTIQTTALTVNSGGTTLTNSAGTVALTVTGGVNGTGNLILDNNSATNGGVNLSGTSVNNTGTITNSGNGAGSVTISAVIGTNVTGVTENSSTSLLKLSGANTYAGPTTVTTGTLQAGVASVAGVSGAFGNNSAVSLANTAGATLDLNGNNTQIGSLSGGGGAGGNVTIEGATLTIGGAGINASYAGVISGTGGVASTSTGTQTLTGANSYSGATTVSQGALVAGGNVPSTAVNGVFGDATSSIALGSTTLTGAAAVLTNGDFTFARNIQETTGTLTNSKLSIGGTQTSGTATFTGNIGLTGATTLTSAAGGEVDFTTGVISGAQNLSIGGGGLVKLTGANTFGSATANANSVTITGGTTLNLATAATTASLGASGNGLIFNNGIFQYTAGTPFDLSAQGRTITINSGGATIDTNGNAITFANAIGNSGTGGLTLADSNGTPGSLTLDGHNTYTGGTTVTSGTLITNGGTLGGTSGALAVNTGGNLNLDGTSQTVGNLTGTGGAIYNNGSGLSTLTVGTGNGTGGNYAGVIENNTGSGGTVAVTKNGSGMITLSGAETYTGATAINNGTLAVGAGGSLGGTAVTVNNTGALQVGVLNSSAATTIGTFGAGSLTIDSGGALTFTNGIANAVSSAADILNINNTASGATVLNLNGGTINIGVGSTTGSDEIVLGSGLNASASGTTTVNLNVISALNGTNQQLIAWNSAPVAGTFTIGTVNGIGAGGFTLSLTETSAGLFLDESAVSNAYWQGSAGSSWSNISNFTTDSAGNNIRTAPLDSLTSVIFNAAGAANFANTTLDSSPTISSLTFDVGGVGIGAGSGGTLTIAASGSAVTVASGLGAVTETISADVALGNSQTWTVNDAASTLAVSGNISGSGFGIIKAGSGTLVLSGVNSYSGATSVAGGYLSIQSADALDGTSGVSVTSGASLLLQNGSGFTTTNATNLTLNGTGVSTGGALENVSGDNTYTGNITLASDSSIGSDSGLLTLSAFTLTTNGNTLTLVGAGNGELESVITSGALTMNGTGTWTIDGVIGSNSYSGATTVNSGVLQLGNSGLGTLGSGSNPLVVNGGALDLNGNDLVVGNLSGTGGTITNNNSGTEVFLEIGSAANGSYAGSITNGASGTGIIDLFKQGSGVITLSGADTYTGPTGITQGALNIASNGALGTGALTSTGSVTVARGAALQLSNNITTEAEVPLFLVGTGVSASPNGALENVSGTNTFTGPITLTGAASIGSDAGSTLVLSSTATIGGTNTNLTLVGGGNGAIASAIGIGSGNLTLNGTGTWTLSGANTYTGPTFVNSGELVYTAASVLQHSSSLNIGSTNAGSTPNLTYSGSGETVANALNITGTDTVTLGNSGTGAVVYNATPSIGAGSKTIVFGNTTDTVGGSIGGIANGSTGSVSLVKTGAINSTWILTGNNTYTGGTTINGGVLQVASASALPSGFLNLTGAVSNSILQTSGTLSLTTGTNLNWGGSTAGGGGFSAFGGNLTLNINNGGQLTWGTNIGGVGGAFVAFGSSTSNAQVILSNAINLNTGDGFQQSIYVAKGTGGDSTLLSGVISGGTSVGSASGLTKAGAGTLILSNANNSYSGYTSIEAGTLIAEASSTVTAAGTTAATTGVFGSGYGAFGGATPTAGFATIYVGTNQGGGTTIGGVINPTLLIGGNYSISNPIAIDWNNGTGQVFGIGGYLNANSTFSGLITLTNPAAVGNTFAVTQVATTGSNALNITGGITATNGGNINFANVGAVDVSTTGISNGGATAVSVTQTGTGVTSLGVASTYTGGTSVNAGALILNNPNGSAVGTGALTVGANATVAGTGGASTVSASSYTINGGSTATRATVLVGQNAALANSDKNIVSTLTLKTAGSMTIANANLVFNLNLAAVGGSGLGGTLNVGSSGNELLLGNTNVTFGTGVDSVNLTLNMQNSGIITPPGTPYVLFAGTGTTSTGAGVSTGQYAGLTLAASTSLGSGITENIISQTNLDLLFGSSASTASFGTYSYLVLYQNANTGVDDIDVEVVPEPSTWAMMLGGLAALFFWQRRKSKRCRN